MYNIPYFKEQDRDTILRFVRQHPFAFISGCDSDNKPVATQIPLFIDEKDGKLFLSGHIMRQSDHHRAFLYNPNVLAVFTGAHTYISASWYENKQQVSTWNYMSVHAKGVITFLDEQALLDVLKRTTNHFENNVHSGANFEDIPVETIERMSKAIVAFTVEVQSLDAIFKLSQNRDEKTYHAIIQKLKEQGGDGNIIAAEMESRARQLYGNKVEARG